ncbi:MAG: GTP-binding protein, partial [Nanoarchaeota archaeon]|nr:GTP-binding protein [Nanoarchaeota archaeon]
MNIRNFSIIAHVDHGKSTLADRLLEITGTVAKEKMQEQLLDSLALERERGITIKLAPVRLNYTLSAVPYTLNLIDTPGHVDFSYEVSRALAAVEGAVILIDATQGIQAQTLAHGLSALEQNLTLIPVINKIDLPNADVEKYKKQLMDTFG